MLAALAPRQGPAQRGRSLQEGADHLKRFLAAETLDHVQGGGTIAPKPRVALTEGLAAIAEKMEKAERSKLLDQTADILGKTWNRQPGSDDLAESATPNLRRSLPKRFSS